MLSKIKKLTDGLTNAKTLHDYDNFQDAIDDYAYTKCKAGSKTPGFDAKNSDLKQFFARKSKAPKGGNQPGKDNPRKDKKKDDSPDIHFPKE